MLVLEIVLGSIVLISFTLALLTELIVPDAKIDIWMKNNVWNLDSFLATMSSSVSMLLHGFLSIVIVYAACKVVRIILNSRRNKNSKTKRKRKDNE